MFWLGIVSHWTHVLAGTFWFGSVLYANLVLGPALARSSPQAQGEVGGRIGERGPLVFAPAALLTVALGVVNGMVFGPVHSVEFIARTAYGLTWFFALLLAVGLMVWGAAVTGRAARTLGDVPPEGRAAAMARVVRFARIELLGFLAVFTCMVLMRYGL